MKNDQDILSKEVGKSQWEYIGKLQLLKLVEAGLKPEHKLLDIGCGMLRGAEWFIPYLSDGNYYGVDQSIESIDKGKARIVNRGGQVEKSTFLVNEDFTFSFDTKFDYIIAQSLFPHLSKTQIKKCLEAVKRVLSDEGKFFASLFCGEGKVLVWTQGRKTKTYDGQDPYHYRYEDIEALAAEVGLYSELQKDWGHPRGQSLITFFTHVVVTPVSDPELNELLSVEPTYSFMLPDTNDKVAEINVDVGDEYAKELPKETKEEVAPIKKRKSKRVKGGKKNAS